VIPFDRDASSADALLTDLYLDAILAGRSLHGNAVADRAGARGAPSVARPDGPSGRLDPAVKAASDRLRHDLVRVHPSFRFEERLATRLAEAAVALRMPTAVGAEGHLVPFRTPSGRPTTASPAEIDSALIDDLLGNPMAIDRRDLGRPLLIGGALTSAALSLAGAALVAWRRTRPGSPMARAARAVRDARDAAGNVASLPFRSRRLD
jgi:hypothetical protein